MEDAEEFSRELLQRVERKWKREVESLLKPMEKLSQKDADGAACDVGLLRKYPQAASKS